MPVEGSAVADLQEFAAGLHLPIPGQLRLRVGPGLLRAHPATAFLAAAKSFEHVYTALKETRSSTSVKPALYDFPAFSKLMGFDWVTAFDQAHAKPDSTS
jgi:hypothetical protein